MVPKAMGCAVGCLAAGSLSSNLRPPLNNTEAVPASCQGSNQPRVEPAGTALLGQLSTPGESGEGGSDGGGGQYSVSSPGHSAPLRDYRRLNRCCTQTDYKQTRGQAVTSLAKQAEALPLPTDPLGEVGRGDGAGNFSTERSKRGTLSQKT